MTLLEEFGAPCVCGAENFERIVVERVIARPVVTDLVACVECRCVYYAPLPRPEPPRPASSGGPPLPDGVVSERAGLLERWGRMPEGYRAREQSAEELQGIKDAAARANRSKPKR